MATRYFLLLDGIDGGSTDAAHVGWFDIDGYAFDVTATAASPGTGSGGSAGRTDFSPVTVDLTFDEGFAEILQSAATGRHLLGAKIEAVTEGESPQTIQELTFGDVIITAVHDESETDDGVSDDSLSFDYARIGVVTHDQAPDGSIEVSGSFGFDRASNSTIDPASLPDLSPATASGASPDGTAPDDANAVTLLGVDATDADDGMSALA
ncbi:MAG TPA: type VI secretion system tube protein Hcp [Alphaproteobacteria bacterium]